MGHGRGLVEIRSVRLSIAHEAVRHRDDSGCDAAFADSLSTTTTLDAGPNAGKEREKDERANDGCHDNHDSSISVDPGSDAAERRGTDAATRNTSAVRVASGPVEEELIHREARPGIRTGFAFDTASTVIAGLCAVAGELNSVGHHSLALQISTGTLTRRTM